MGNTPRTHLRLEAVVCAPCVTVQEGEYRMRRAFPLTDRLPQTEARQLVGHERTYEGKIGCVLRVLRPMFCFLPNFLAFHYLRV